MKPIDYCLDKILLQLYENRLTPENRKSFDVDKILQELELSTHEEFKSLVDILVADKYALFLDGYKDVLEHYKNKTVITVKGTYFYEQGGYLGEKNRKTSKKNRIQKQDEQIRLLTLFLAIGSIGVLIIEAVKFLLDYVY